MSQQCEQCLMNNVLMPMNNAGYIMHTVLTWCDSLLKCTQVDRI